MKAPAPRVVALTVPAGAPDWAGLARGIGAAARAYARPRRIRAWRFRRAALTLHDFPMDTQDLAGRQDQAA